ncbi:MAG: isopeptide-forming domain-containing fimbrial protein [Clostridiales bacterium]|nr:isopeptide-forming domain-containing fimbrial protein [Clostridiales bacterium]
MRKMKKFASVLLALVMVFAMNVTAFAADGDGYTITINNSTSGYVYTAYQIFAGDLSEDGNTLSNITWGTGIGSSNEQFLAALNDTYGTTDAAEIAAKIEDAEDVAAFAAIVADYVTSGTTSVQQSDGTYTITVDDAGYYLIVNTTVPADGEYTDYILEVVDDVNVDPKTNGTPTFDKTVTDVNDSDNTTTQGDTDSADYDIGDDVPFTLTATLPSDLSLYTSYKLVFHDTLSSGLTFNNDVVVKVGNVTLSAEDYTVAYTTDETTGETTITITISDLLDIEGLSLTSGTEVVVTYTAGLNDNASYEENNKAYVEYSNNPYDEDSTGSTPEDITTVFTFTLTVNKVDSEGNALKDAGFTLYKYNADTETYEVVGKEITGDGLTTFTWEGLDDGQYKLVETTTPDGYNTMDDLYFTIEASHTEDGITSLVIKDADGNTISGTGLSFTTSTSDGTISTNITNYKGSELPSTGGMGTTIFYIVGGVLVLGAAVLLITRKRMSAAK